MHNMYIYNIILCLLSIGMSEYLGIAEYASSQNVVYLVSLAYKKFVADIEVV